MSDLVNSPDPGTETEPGEIWGAGAAEKSYAANGFDPANADSGLSLTPRRVAKTVFNAYQRGNGLTLAGHLESVGTYDSRYGQSPGNTDVDYREGGPGADIARGVPVDAFDEIVIGPLGIIGDEGALRETVNQAAIDFQIAAGTNDLPNQRGKVTFTDHWGDTSAYLGFGFPGWQETDFTPERAQGLLGRAVAMKKANPNLNVGLMIGGWKLSQAFHSIAQDHDLRQRFADSIRTIADTFPMVTSIHLDWQWPNYAGDEHNFYGPEDPENYAALIKAIRRVAPNLSIAISAPAIPEALKAMNIPLLLQAGVDRIDLLAFDLFGSPWSDKLTHHTPLKNDADDPSLNSVDKAVDFLVNNLAVNPSSIHLAYTAHSRNAQQAVLTSTSPLRGTYAPKNPGQDTTVGSFEPGVSQLADILRNYVDLETGKGRNGFVLHTDEVSDADYLHNPDSRVFISLDTPRSVKAKAEYVHEKGLGGLFAWRADTDNGVLANAAREGLGHTATKTSIDMKPLYIVNSK